VQKPIRNSGFFVAFSPKTYYKIYQNPVILGIRERVIYTQKGESPSIRLLFSGERKHIYENTRTLTCRKLSIKNQIFDY
jgi:hypothetical protein